MNDKPNALGLVPNEIVGFRIRTDEFNYAIVLVKRHGVASKFAGQTYDTPLSYHKSLEHAASALVERAVRMRSEGTAPDDGTNAEAWALRLADAIRYAHAQALEAVKVEKSR